MGELGLQGKWKSVALPGIKPSSFHTRRKDRNSGAIILYSSWPVQVTFARRRWNSVAKSGDSGGAGAAEVGRNRMAQKIQSRLCSRVCETDENLGQ